MLHALSEQPDAWLSRSSLPRDSCRPVPAQQPEREHEQRTRGRKRQSVCTPFRQLACLLSHSGVFGRVHMLGSADNSKIGATAASLMQQQWNCCAAQGTGVGAVFPWKL